MVLHGTFAAERVVIVENTWHDGPEVTGTLADEPRHAAVVKEVLDNTETKCAWYYTNCAALVGAFETEDWYGNAKMSWNDFYVTEVDGEVKAYCVDCITDVAPV